MRLMHNRTLRSDETGMACRTTVNPIISLGLALPSAIILLCALSTRPATPGLLALCA